MKVLALAIAAAGTVAVVGCSREPRRPPGPRIAIESTTHDFGPLWIGEVVQHTFVVKNEGNILLDLGDVRSTCGCLLHKVSERRIDPGRSAEVVAELHADKAPGPLVKMLRIRTNDADRLWLDLTLTAQLKTLYQVEPALLDVQDLVLGEPRDLVVKVTGTDGTPLRFGTPECKEKGFTVSLRAPSDQGTEVVVRFLGEAFPGRRVFHVSVPTQHPKVPEATLPVQAVVLARLSVEPGDRADFGEVKRAAGGRVEFTVRRRGEAPLTSEPTVLVEEKSSEPRVTARLIPVVEGREWKLVAEVAPGSPGGNLVGRISVRLDAPLEPPHTLTLAGRIVD